MLTLMKGDKGIQLFENCSNFFLFGLRWNANRHIFELCMCKNFLTGTFCRH